MINLVSLLQKSDHPALIDGNRSISFSDFHAKVAETAAGFTQLGIEPGNRILLLMPMSIELYQSLLALFWIDATVMLVDPSAPLDRIFARFRPHGFIGSSKAHFLRFKYKALRGLDFYISTGFTPLPHRRLHRLQAQPIPAAAPQHPALLTFTTGTTGIPKAMARSHDFLLAQHKALAHHMDFRAGDVDMPTLPVFLLHSLAAGASCVLPDADLRQVGSVQAEPLIQQIKTHEISSMSGAPAFFNALCRPLLESNQQLPSIQKIFTGGGRVMAADVLRIQKSFPNATIHIVYGSTEAEPIATLDASTRLSELLEGEQQGIGALVGQPVDEVQVRIVNDELWVSGAHVNQSYFQSPEADAENKVHDAGRVWHRTGDAAMIRDTDIWLLGRIGDAIEGHWPMPIEGALLQMDWVKQAALVNYQDRAALVLVLEAAPDDWREQLRHLSELPVICRDRIPLDPRHNTKIDRRRLQAELAQLPQDLC